MSLGSWLFYILGSMTLSSGLMVISSRNPVHSVLFLILVFCNSSCLLILLECEFLALIFIIVYVGAIAVLFLFVIMMLNVKLSELSENIVRYLPVGSLLAIIFFVEISLVLGEDLVTTFVFPISLDLMTEFHFNRSSLISWGFIVESSSNIQLFGHVLYSNYVYLFIISSMILLVAMISAIVLTLHKRLSVKKQDVYKQVSTNFEKIIVNYV